MLHVQGYLHSTSYCMLHITLPTSNYKGINVIYTIQGYLHHITCYILPCPHQITRESTSYTLYSVIYIILHVTYYTVHIKLQGNQRHIHYTGLSTSYYMLHITLFTSNYKVINVIHTVQCYLHHITWSSVFMLNSQYLIMKCAWIILRIMLPIFDNLFKDMSDLIFLGLDWLNSKWKLCTPLTSKSNMTGLKVGYNS